MAEFSADYIESEFGKIGLRLKRRTSIYLIGGCAMSFRNLKRTTKDVDIVFENMEDYGVFVSALFGAQYVETRFVLEEHGKLDALKMFESKDGLHLDLFVGMVCGKLKLSKAMIERCEKFKSVGLLEVNLISKEDIFIFKVLASHGRKRDLSDMAVLYLVLNWKVIFNEISSQKLSKADITHIIERLEEFKRVHFLDVPILSKLKRLL